MKTEFATLLVVTMLAAMLPANSSAMARDESPSQALRQGPSAQVLQPSTPCAQASLHLGACEQQLRKVRRAYERFRRTYVDRFDELEQAVRTLRSAEPPSSGSLIAGVPSWLYCRLHPRWCTL